MNDIQKILTQTEMIAEKTLCGLKHAPGETIPKAINQIVIPFGFVGSSEVINELMIPICKECEESLMSGEWAILYCTNCHASVWILKSRGRRVYQTVEVLKACPECARVLDNGMTRILK